MNRNYLKYILIGGVSIFVWTGCDDYLNRESTSGVNTPDLIWQNPKAITAVLADMYDSGLKLDEFDDWYGSKKANLANQTSLSDEATASYQKESAFDKSNSTYSYGDYVFNDDMVTRYKQIRIVNNFLLNIEKTSVLSEDEKEELGAEARFIRAMQYFGLVKRYGGVPLVDRTLTMTDQMGRASVQQTIDFILRLCRESKELMGDHMWSNEWTGRLFKGVILAIEAETLTYAARPLFNSNAPYLDMHPDNDLIWLGGYDEQRYRDAIKANLDVIEWGKQNGYVLIKTGNPMEDFGTAVGTLNSKETRTLSCPNRTSR